MVKVLLYAYCVGVPSSRRMEQRLHEDIAFRVRAANNTPDFRTISDFGKEHLAALESTFLQVLQLCQRAGLVVLGPAFLDGTKVRANASKHQGMSYGRMKQKGTGYRRISMNGSGTILRSGPIRGDTATARSHGRPSWTTRA